MDKVSVLFVKSFLVRKAFERKLPRNIVSENGVIRETTIISSKDNGRR